ncbi:NAD(P)/FAD-dependent oxidoreductase [Craterilacuibacter sinensis]|uniref:NAD(P)/FAD-dependent oxidoreductase n=1 Tax=Craterilacuibacter sinensis TaxID=2686017 RepID=UPI00136A71B5|nr:FAD-binding oxidoreductase [Craterilacuibacter sinensis]
MRHFYHQNMYRFDTAAQTYWHHITPGPDLPSLVGEHAADVAIVGAGFTGLSAALHLARDHGIQACVVDAGDLAWGASGRNAGFNTLPATKLGLDQLFDRWGTQAASDFLAAQHEGQLLVDEFCDSEGLQIRHGRGSYMVAHAPSAWRDLQEEFAVWRRYSRLPCRLLTADAFADEGHGGSEQFGALHIESGGGINPLAFAYGLARAALRHGAEIYTHSAVTALHKERSGHVLQTAQGRLRARHVVFATNAYPAQAQPAALDRRLLPAISNILVTAPLSDECWASEAYQTLSPAFDTRHLLNYYRRLPDNRLLFGARGDLTGSEQDGERMRQALRRALARKFPAFSDAPVEHYWRGLVSVTRSMVPAMGETEQGSGLWYAFGCFGNGVNTMPWMGRTLARQIAGSLPTPTEACPVFQGLPPKLPSGNWLQKLGLRLAYSRYALLDQCAR